MRERTERFDVGVIVGRFQVPELHEAHRALIDYVVEQHDKVVMVLGVSPLWVTTENPLDFEARKQMIVESYPDINVLYIKDRDSDAVWSKKLDALVADVIHPGQTAVLYGSRASFIEAYTGRLPTRELEAELPVSGTDIRRQVARAKARATGDFRAGVVWATHARFPTAIATVDIAIMSVSDPMIAGVLLVRKPDEPLFRFPGGFADPASESDEQDAAREALEETGLTVGNLTYLGSTNIDDWRYRSERDKIRTRLFLTVKPGVPDPQDDEIAEARWFVFRGLRRRDLMPAHRPLLVMLRDYLTRDNDERAEQ